MRLVSLGQPLELFGDIGNADLASVREGAGP